MSGISFSQLKSRFNYTVSTVGFKTLYAWNELKVHLMQQVSLDAASVVAAQTGLLTQVLDGGRLVVLRMLGALYQSRLTARAPGWQSRRRAQSQMVWRPTQSRLVFCARLTVLVFAFRLCSWIAFVFTLFRICELARRLNINQKKRTLYMV